MSFGGSVIPRVVATKSNNTSIFVGTYFYPYEKEQHVKKNKVINSFILLLLILIKYCNQERFFLVRAVWFEYTPLEL